MVTSLGPNRIDLVWLLSTSVQANDLVNGMLQSAIGATPQEVVVQRFASEADPPLEPRVGKTLLGCTVAAAVLVLEPQVHADDALRRWVATAAARTAQDDSFRLFVCLQGWTIPDVRAAAATDSFLANLLDVVQLSESPNPADVTELLVGYLSQVEQLRATALYRRCTTLGASIVGRVAGGVEIFSLVAVAATALALLVAAPFGARATVSDWLQSWAGAAIPLVAGWSIFPALSSLIFVALNDRSLVRRVWEGNRSLHAGVGALLLMAVAAIAIVASTNQWNGWFVQGLAWGVVLDAARRRGVRALRKEMRLDPKHLPTPGHPLYDDLRATALGRPIDPFVYPLLPPQVPKVFVSYARASPWADALSASLHAQLEAGGAQCFLDHRTIVPGTSWRRQLNQWMSEVDLVIVLADSVSVDPSRDWVGAEVRAALLGRCFTGTPDIFVVMEESMPRGKAGGRAPIFDDLLYFHPSRLTRLAQPRLALATPTTLNELIAEIRPGCYAAASIIPRPMAFFLQVLIAPFYLLAALGPLGGMASHGVNVLFLTGAYHLGADLAVKGTIGAACLVLGFWSGVNAALALRSVEISPPSDIRQTPPLVRFLMMLLPVVGCVTLLGVWQELISPQMIGLSWFAAACGWLLIFATELAPRRPRLAGASPQGLPAS